MPIAVSYIRFSSAEQSNGGSLDRQEDRAVEWFGRNPSYTRYEKTFRDLGLSGYKGHHITEGALGKLLDAIEQGYIPAGSVVLVEALDRFSRLEPLQTLLHLETIIKAGVDLITLKDGVRYDQSSLKSQSLMMLAYHAFAAFDYSDNISGNIVLSYNHRADAAKLGNPIKRRNPFWLTSDGKLVAEPAKVIQQAFLSFANGVPLRLIANRNSEHFANRQSLKHALRNIAAIGHWQRTKTVLVDGKEKRVPGELIKGVFEEAVTDELFYQVQKMLDGLADQPVTVARKFPLAGLLQCGDCGANMVLLRQNARQQTDAVRCYRRMQNSAKCTNQKTIPVPVIGWFYEATRKPHAFRAYQRTKLPENQRHRIKLEGQIDQLKQQQARLRHLVILDASDKDAQADYQKLVDEKRLLTEELEFLPTVADTAVVGMPEFHRFLNTDPFAISNLLQQDGYRIVCHRDGALEVKVSADDNLAEVTQYVGYARKYKMWEIKPINGDALFVDNYGQVQFPQYVTITTSEQWQQRIKGMDLSAYMDDDLADYIDAQD